MMKQIGRYEILEELGYGGMATVYKAHDPQISRTLAIKVLRPERCRDAEYRRRFLREAKAVGTLSHPNIVTIYDIGEADNTPYIAMEMLEGVSLDKLMKSDYKPSMIEILEWSIQLVNALEYAHQRGIIHRDIKPSNIVLSKDKSTVKITDFGIAHFDETDVTQHTQLGEVLGTPQYMSPEQVLGKPADARSDLFSVGVIMYQLLTGQKPFQADTLATLLFQIATENPEPIGQVAPALPGSLKQTVDKLLKKKPEKRFQSGAELKHALVRIVNDLKQEKQDVGTTHTSSIRGKWLILSTLVLTTVLSLSGFFLYQVQKDLNLQGMAEHGKNLAEFIAFESAETVLSEDWPAVELFAQHVSEQQEFRDLFIVDFNKIVRGSSQASLLGKVYQASVVQSSTPMGKSKMNVVKSGVEEQYEIQAPIMFQTTHIGTVYVALDKKRFMEFNHKFLLYYGIASSLIILISLIMVTVFHKQLRSPIQTLRKAMGEMEEGNTAYRIGVQRKDEFGALYEDFDKMAASIQGRDEFVNKK